MKYFGTDGIRKKNDFFTESFLDSVCTAVVSLKKCPLIVVARDPRESGLFIEDKLTGGLTKSGARVISLGMTATPVLAYCTRAYNADFGIMISASHNPPEYNGIKFFDSEGRKISGYLEEEIERLLGAKIKSSKRAKGFVKNADGDAEYIERLVSLLKPSILPKKILLDTANGATSFVAPRLFKALGCAVETIFRDTDSNSINKGCGATSPQAFIDKIETGKYDAGFSFDGDGDRVLAYCGGRLLDGDHIMYIIAKYLYELNELKGKTLVGTIMSNCGVEEAVIKSGFDFVRTSVGDKYVAEEMKKTGAELGGEASGHIIVGKYQNTGDGMLAAVMLTAADSHKSVGAYDDIIDYPQTSGDIFTTAEKVAAYKAIEKELAPKLDAIRAECKGRLVVRPSGTEPKIRIMAEAPTMVRAYLAVAKARECILRGIR